MSGADLFRGTASYYARFRPPYPDELFAHLIERYGLGPQSRVLDLGCGTGQLALSLAVHVGQVLGMDPQPEMLDVAAQIAAERGITNVTWMEGGSDDLQRLSSVIGTPNLIGIGRAFHWMDEQRTLRALYALLPPGGGLMIVGDTCNLWGGNEDWQTAVVVVVKRWLGEQRRAGAGQYTVVHQPWEEMFPASVFGGYEYFHRTIQRTWDVDGIIGYLYSTSFCSPALLAERRSAFERDLRETLLALHADNVFHETVELGAFLMFRPATD